MSLKFFALTVKVIEDISATERVQVYRAKIPGGWLILATSPVAGNQHEQITFVPDATHTWNGESLP